MNKLLSIWVLLFVFGGNTQENLILNPSFEENDSIPVNMGGYPYVTNWWRPYNPDYEVYTSDYFTSIPDPNNIWIQLNLAPNTIFGYQLIHNGSYFIGISLHVYLQAQQTFNVFNTDYIGGCLIQPLETGKIYEFSFYMNRPDSAFFQTNSLGVAMAYDTVMDVSQVDNYGYLIYLEDEFFTDTVNWIKVSACFKARGGEKAFVVGGFRDRTDMKYICAYEPPNLPGCLDYRFLDDFSLRECPTCCPEVFGIQPFVEVFGNPTSTQSGISAKIWTDPDYLHTFRVYDSRGRLVWERAFYDPQEVNIPNLAAGVYHFDLRNELGVQDNGKVVVY